MGSCRKALVNETLCEETVILTHLNRGVVIGDLSVPAGSELSGQTTVHNLDCSPTFHQGLFGVRITLFVQEELILTTPQGSSYPLHFGFRFQEFHPLMECYQVRCLKSLSGELDCRISLLGGSNCLALNCNGTFDQCLKVTAHVKILRQRQLRIALCPCAKNIEEKQKEVVIDDEFACGGPLRSSGIRSSWPSYARGVSLGKTPKQTRRQDRRSGF